jgi:hypothetical protein
VPCFPLWLCLSEDGVFKPKHVGECKLCSSTTCILSVKKVQLVGIIFNKCTYIRYTEYVWYIIWRRICIFLGSEPFFFYFCACNLCRITVYLVSENHLFHKHKHMENIFLVSQCVGPALALNWTRQACLYKYVHNDTIWKICVLLCVSQGIIINAKNIPVIIKSFFSLWSLGHPWRASRHCNLQLFP